MHNVTTPTPDPTDPHLAHALTVCPALDVDPADRWWMGSNRYGEHWSQWPGHTDRPWWQPPGLVAGDYCGGPVGAANVRDWRAMFAHSEGDAWTVRHLAHNTESIFIHLGRITPAMAAAICALADYPLICDETLGEVEDEARAESWSNWGSWDFRRALAAALEDLDDEHPAWARLAPHLDVRQDASDPDEIPLSWAYLDAIDCDADDDELWSLYRAGRRLAPGCDSDHVDHEGAHFQIAAAVAALVSA